MKNQTWLIGFALLVLSTNVYAQKDDTRLTDSEYINSVNAQLPAVSSGR
jgi:hypothetical protein